VWAILRGYGTVLWRQETPAGQRAGLIAWTLAGLPLKGHELPPKACPFSTCVNLVDLGKTLAKRAEETSQEAQKPSKNLQHTHAAHSAKTAQQTLPFAAH
jgi:hypothetical protein